jgi:hypothetical protein
MPGRRHYARERALHAAHAVAQQRRIYELLKAQLPDHERALAGRDAILSFLRTLGLTRRNGMPLTWRMILRWHRDLGFPLVRGAWHPNTRTHLPSRSPALTTTYAATAWILSQFSTDSQGLFRVCHPTVSSTPGSLPTSAVSRNIGSTQGIGRGRWVRPLAFMRLADPG